VALETGDSLYWKTGIDTGGVSRGADEVKGILRNLTRSISGMDIFAGLGIGAAAIFAKISKEAYDFSIQFESAMKEVQTISRAVQQDFQGISQEIIDMSKEVPENAQKLAKGLYQIVSAGYDGAEAMDMLRQSAKLAVAGVSDTYTAADAITSIMNAYGEAAGNAANISDKLFTTIKNAKTTMRELGPEITTVTGLAAQAGVAFDDLMAIISTGAKTLKTPEMMTGIRGMLTAIIKPSEEAKELIAELGIEFDTAALKAKGFQGFLNDLITATDGNIEMLSQLFPNVRGLTGLLSVATDEGKEFERQLQNIQSATGATEDAFRVMMETTENQVAILKNNVMAKLKPFGDWLVGFVNDVAGGINRAMEEAKTEFEIAAGHFDDVTEALKTQKSTIEGYIRTIEDLRGKTELTAKETAELEAAEKNLNFLLPELNRNWKDNKTALDNIILAKERIIELDKEMMEYQKKAAEARVKYLQWELAQTEKETKKFEESRETWQKLADETRKDLYDMLLAYAKNGQLTVGETVKYVEYMREFYTKEAKQQTEEINKLWREGAITEEEAKKRVLRLTEELITGNKAYQEAQGKILAQQAELTGKVPQLKGEIAALKEEINLLNAALEGKPSPEKPAPELKERKPERVTVVDVEKVRDELKAMQDQYKAYWRIVTEFGEDYVKEHNAQLAKDAENYGDYLQEMLTKYRDNTDLMKDVMLAYVDFSATERNRALESFKEGLQRQTEESDAEYLLRLHNAEQALGEETKLNQQFFAVISKLQDDAIEKRQRAAEERKRLEKEILDKAFAFIHTREEINQKEFDKYIELLREKGINEEMINALIAARNAYLQEQITQKEKEEAKKRAEETRREAERKAKIAEQAEKERIRLEEQATQRAFEYLHEREEIEQKAFDDYIELLREKGVSEETINELILAREYRLQEERTKKEAEEAKKREELARREAEAKERKAERARDARIKAEEQALQKAFEYTHAREEIDQKAFDDYIRSLREKGASEEVINTLITARHAKLEEERTEKERQEAKKRLAEAKKEAEAKEKEAQRAAEARAKAEADALQKTFEYTHQREEIEQRAFDNYIKFLRERQVSEEIIQELIAARAAKIQEEQARREAEEAKKKREEAQREAERKQKEAEKVAKIRLEAEKEVTDKIFAYTHTKEEIAQKEFEEYIQRLRERGVKEEELAKLRAARDARLAEERTIREAEEEKEREAKARRETERKKAEAKRIEEARIKAEKEITDKIFEYTHTREEIAQREFEQYIENLRQKGVDEDTINSLIAARAAYLEEEKTKKEQEEEEKRQKIAEREAERKQRELERWIDPYLTAEEKITAIHEKTAELIEAADDEVTRQLLKNIEKRMIAETRLAEFKRLADEKMAEYGIEMNNQELADWIRFLEEMKKKYKDYAEIIILIDKEITRSQEQIWENIQTEVRKTLDTMRALADFVGLFNSELEKTVNSLADLYEGITELGKGMATGDLLSYLSGITSIITSIGDMFTYHYSDVPRIQKELEKMTLEFQKQQNILKYSRGLMRPEEIFNTIAMIERQIGKYQELIRAEKNARGEFRTWFITWNTWSETDWAKIRQWQAEIEEANWEIVDLMRQLQEILTGTTVEKLADTITAGFTEGLDSAQLFADTFEDMMRKAIIDAFKRTIITKYIEAWYDEFATLAGEGLTPEEIAQLSESYQEMLEGAEDYWEQVQAFMESVGLEAVAGREGLAGAIAGITEQTAGLLAGQFQAIRINTMEMLSHMESIIIINSKIADNTSYEHLEKYLASIDRKLGEGVSLEQEYLRSIGET